MTRSVSSSPWRTRARRAAAGLLAGCATLLQAPLTAPPARAQGDTSAVVVNTHDGLDLFRIMFQVRRVMGDTVDTQNAAVAYASCTECETLAVSFQIVLAMNDPSVVAPENYAIAENVACSLCTTLAEAYQFVLTGESGPLVFTAEGNRRLADIRSRLRELARSDLTTDQLQTALDAIAAEIRDVLATQLISAGPRAAPTPTPAPSASPTATSGATPPASPSPTPNPGGDSASPGPASTPSATTTASPQPSPSATSSPSPTATGGV